MATPIKAFWWSPRRDLRALAHELRDHAPAWVRLAPGRGRAFTNHGDELSELVLREALGRPVEWAPLGREDVVAIGSAVVPYLTRGGIGRIWGTGLHRPDVPDEQVAPIRDRVLGIRGPMARAALGLPDTTPLGDPGLLVRTLRPGLPSARRRGTVLITHFLSHMTRTDVRTIATLRSSGVRVLPATLTPSEMLTEIGAAEHVLSTGMHGLILAHALRTPATHVSLRTPAADAPFKYHDYHRSVGLEARPVAWTTVADAVGRAAAHECAARDLEVADGRIDDLVEGLFRSAAPLRSGG